MTSTADLCKALSMSDSPCSIDSSSCEPLALSWRSEADPLFDLAQKMDRDLSRWSSLRISGMLTDISAEACQVAGLGQFVQLGDCVGIDQGTDELARAEVIRIQEDRLTIKPFSALAEARLGTRVYRLGPHRLFPHFSWKGRLINALAEPLDGLGFLQQGDLPRAFDAPPPLANRRAYVHHPLKTGIRAIDLFTPLCLGQRIGIFAGSGVGKSTLLHMMARASGFDTIVVGLIGERGREVRDHVEMLQEGHKEKTITVVSTSDESPVMRRLAARTAMTIAEYFRDLGESVLLILDSITRYAHAVRTLAASAGEAPVARGYAPSVFSDLARLLERAGPGLEGQGTVTAVFSVLVDGDDHNEPIADNIRGIVDGHIVLDRAIADSGRYPAVHLLGSKSRLADRVWSADERQLILKILALIARFEDTRDLRSMGGYKPGIDPILDQAVTLVPKIYNSLTQASQDPSSQDAFSELAAALRSE